MAMILFLVFMILEIGFAVFEFTKNTSKKDWTKKRLIVNAAELVIYLVMMFLPGIDFSFRFKALALILVLRAVVGAFFAAVNRNNENTRKKAAVIGSLFLSFVLLAGSMIPAFVFADYQGRELTGEFSVSTCESILVDQARTESFENDGSSREVPVYFYYPENIDSIEQASLPLIIFSHGAFGYYQSNTSTYMELASHGYVVVSLDHPYHSFFTKDINGKTILVDREFIQTAMVIGGDNNPLTEEETYRITSKWMELREADLNFVIDTLKSAAEMSSFDESWHMGNNEEKVLLSVVKAINTDKIGLMGHSLGGAAAVTVGRRADISAVVDLDGTMLGEETGVKDGKLQFNEEPYDTPIYNIISESHHESELEAKETDYLYANNVVLSHAVHGHETYIKNTGHMNFTDLPLFSPALAGFLGTGSVDAGKCIDQVNALCLQFFDSYLKDAGAFSPAESY